MRNEQAVSSPKFKAEPRGQSLEQDLREILKHAAELTAEEKLAFACRGRPAGPRCGAEADPAGAGGRT